MSTHSARRPSCAPLTAAALESSAMIEVEVFGALDDLRSVAPDAPRSVEVRRLCILATTAAGVTEGHLAVEFVDAERISELNAEHRGRRAPTDVLSFPIDGVEAGHGVPRELGDVVICPEHTSDLREAIVHGVLHLLGMDHETDAGEMLALQAELLSSEAAHRGPDADLEGPRP
jgi:probable rRNA maturation factor